MATPTPNKPRPKPSTSNKFVLCIYFAKGGCRNGDNCTYAHSEEELRQWNSTPATSYAGKTTWQQSRRPSCIHNSLSTINYKTKFVSLIEAEREEHQGQLKQRCREKYKYFYISTQCPIELEVKYPERYQMYGILEGIGCEDFAYVKQASSSATLICGFHEARADMCYHKIKVENLYNLYLAFPEYSKIFTCSLDVRVQFHLKEFYFEGLISSVKTLAVVQKLVPSTFQSFDHKENLDVCRVYCSQEQFDALKVIVNSPPQFPPVLLTGAFGTGKSRLLALCALYLLSKRSRSVTRILVCTQQRFSADKFLDYYTSIFWENRNDNVFVIRESGLDGLQSDKQKYYCTSEKFKDKINNSTENRNVLVITTCLTAPHLRRLPLGYFSHIFIDEGSHMREPEAVAPLCIANNLTKIVIAGDTNQIGPANLVRGKVARANSLNISLLQRLETQYLSAPNCQIIAKLSNNYRCHPEILNLISGLFYNSNLQWNDEETEPTTHRKYPYPLVFICSGIDESADAQNMEAEIIIDKVIELAKQTPSAWNSKPMKNYLITSPCENQINEIYKKLKRRKIKDFPEIRTVFQGQEYQAVILSTTEPVNQDGSTLDETKSFCDPYVFNTAITRAKSLVIAVGNPFLLLKMEKSFIKIYGHEHNTHCWSTYLDRTLEKDSFEFDVRLKLTDDRKVQLKEQVKTGISEIQRGKSLEVQNTALEQQVKDRDILLQNKEAELHVKDKEIEDLKKKLKEQRQLSSSPEETSKSVAATSSIATGIGIQQSPTRGGQQMIVQDDFQRTFVRTLSIQHSEKTFEQKSFLGKGGFAQVYHVSEERTGEKYALKVICYNRNSKKILREVVALQKLEHDRIVRYVSHWKRDDHHGWWISDEENPSENKQYLFILTELCKKDTLHNWLMKNCTSRSRPLQHVKCFFNQILDGLIFIHEKGYVHRDLKPSNILFSLDNQLKIGDFGLVMEETSHNVIQSQNMDSTASTFDNYGTPIYISPEQRQKGQVDSKTDIYALGIILFELFYPNKMLCEERNKVLEKIPTGNFPGNFVSTFREISNLIMKMVQNKPSDRPLAKEVQVNFSRVEFSSEFVSCTL